MNLNDRCIVTLTPHGHAILKADCDDFNTRYPTVEMHEPLKEAIEVRGIEMWHLMQIFGHAMYNGAENVFVDNQLSLI